MARVKVKRRAMERRIFFIWIRVAQKYEAAPIFKSGFG
jgi:hypothetical protein